MAKGLYDQRFCDICGAPAVQFTVDSPFGLAFPAGAWCGKHGPFQLHASVMPSAEPPASVMQSGEPASRWLGNEYIYRALERAPGSVRQRILRVIEEWQAGQET